MTRPESIRLLHSPSRQTMTRSIRTPLGDMWLDDDGVLWHRIDEIMNVTPDDAQEVVRQVADLTGGRAVPAIIDIRGVAYAGHETRLTFAGSPDDSHELATALIVAPGSSKAMATVFTQVTKPDRPVQVFEAEEEAIAWVRSFLPAD